MKIATGLLLAGIFTLPVHAHGRQAAQAGRGGRGGGQTGPEPRIVMFEARPASVRPGGGAGSAPAAQ